MQVLLVCFCRLYLRNHITLLADEAVRKHLKVDSTGSCTNSADANCIHVRHYKFIMFSPHHWHSMECVLLLQMSWRSVICVCVFLFGTSGGGSQPPPHQIWGLGKRCKLSQRGPGRSLGRCKVFLHSIEAPESHSWNLLGPSSGGMASLPPPLKSARARGISMWHGQVSEYENAIEDIANVASDHVLLVDSAANYAVYNATRPTRVNILDTFVAVLSSQSAARVCVCVHITLLLTTS